MARFEGVAVRGVRRVCYPVLIPAPNSCRRSPRVRRFSSSRSSSSKQGATSVSMMNEVERVHRGFVSLTSLGPYNSCHAPSGQDSRLTLVPIGWIRGIRLGHLAIAAETLACFRDLNSVSASVEPCGDVVRQVDWDANIAMITDAESERQVKKL